MLGTQIKNKQAEKSAKIEPSSCQRDLSPCSKLKYPLISGAIKKCTVHHETDHHKHCVWTVILWQRGRPPVPCAKGTDMGWDLKLRRGRGLNKDAVPDER